MKTPEQILKEKLADVMTGDKLNPQEQEQFWEIVKADDDAADMIKGCLDAMNEYGQLMYQLGKSELK
ncbi:MAG: hypothetical protein F9K23_00825 [Bacteroidetes bacterium]|nr:MAG: hypothetical protein F9K23_00825 [Bacteroidota bacterium]